MARPRRKEVAECGRPSFAMKAPRSSSVLMLSSSGMRMI